MKIATCDVPMCSALEQKRVASAYFRDAYRAPLRDPKAAMPEIFFAIFAHHPFWMKLAIVFRNKIVSLFGIATAATTDIFYPRIRASYAVGDTIGPWPIYHMTDNELVAGRDNSHLDFRLSVLKLVDDGNASVVVSTVCTTHNLFGKVYLWFVIPLHRWGVRKIMRNAVLRGRL